MWISVVTLLFLSLFGLKSLFIFSSRNGTLKRLEAALSADCTPGGRPLRPVTTGIKPLDTQVRAVAIFQLVFWEDAANLDASLVYAAFLGAWGSSWFLTLLESFRAYSGRRFLSWTAIPGILVFNYSHALCTPLYLALWLLVKPPVSHQGLHLDASHLRVFPWTILLGFVLPLVLMALPSRRIGGVDTKHTVAGWYQQYHLYMSLVHSALRALWPPQDDPVPAHQLQELVGSAYDAVFLLAAATTYWLPMAACCWSWLQTSRTRARDQLSFASVAVPTSPFRDVQMGSLWQGGKCLLQWDGITGTAATIVWAASLYGEARALAADPEPVLVVVKRVAMDALVGGPMAIPIRLLRERDLAMLLP